jgi:wyosine [tRNA(Phe)-imidazoG37] synthetase (radical SAM superfamily)
VFANSDEENEKFTLMLENFVRPALRNCTMLSSLGSGEFFASKPLLKFYQTLSKEEFPQLKLNIMTNGTLLNPQRWETLSNLKGMVNKIHVSIDAVDKETYEKLRRGGKWEVLCNNMEYVSSLKVSDEIKEFGMSFVVQKENFRQMRDYVTLGKKWNASTVTFRRLKNLTYSPDVYIDNDVFNKENPHYKEAVQILSDIIKERKDIIISDNCIKSDQSDED